GGDEHDRSPPRPADVHRSGAQGHGPAVRSVFGAQRSETDPRPRRGGGRGRALGGEEGDDMTRWLGKMGFPAAALVGCASVWLSANFTREGPAPPARAPGMTIQDGGIALTPDAPQWQVLKLGVVQTAVDRWSDPVPARVVIDETR